MKRMSTELPLSMRMLCTVNLAMFAIATKASISGKSRTQKSFLSNVIGTMDQAGLLSGTLDDTVCTLLS
jgi:DNA-binding IscR family transcriptional regulator